jgi:hypothetical protein
MVTHNVWDAFYDEELLSNLNAKLREAQKLADRQAFGMPRPELTVQFRELLTSVKDEAEALLMRVEACEPKITKQLKGVKLDVHQEFVSALNDRQRESHRLRTRHRDD